MPDRNKPKDRRKADTISRNPKGEADSGGNRKREDPAGDVDSGSLLTSRRQLLSSLSAAPIAASVAGCQDDLRAAERSQAPDLNPSDSTTVGDAVRFGESYAVEVNGESESGTGIRVTGRFHRADHYVRSTNDDVETESYMVDGTGYLVVEGNCIEYPELTAAVDGIVKISDDRLAQFGPTELTVTGTETIKGRSVYRLEQDSTGGKRVNQPVTYFIDRETRYLRRIELGKTTIDYHSWDAVDPIKPPESRCSLST